MATIPSKTDEELEGYITNRRKYVPEAISATIDELQRRGRVFTDEELEEIVRDKNEQIDSERKEDEELWQSSSKGWNKNLVRDENAPALYSERVIYIFSAVFFVLFGSVLVALNIKRTESKNGFWQVLIFGLSYTAGQIAILDSIPRNSILTISFNLFGAFILQKFFWQKYIGKDTKYRARPVWIPLAIGVVLSALFILAAIASEY
ncbi:hypothetical protein MKJ04_22250 [Pontibacter sp. E15-1]|uniref:hypothetical protein n=1 Tax=Pontibacter sp. E15-1 TaxID=2919918 RepID=UPI001F4FC9FC|nr:hypothetical protein [Pontibacter sp. E15-1]MCJ8167581.1 hypothetical protein [Pontibacter sp. E15-1]